MAQKCQPEPPISLAYVVDGTSNYFVLKKILTVTLGASLAYENPKMGRSSIIHTYLFL